jgi:hypothetical protein
VKITVRTIKQIGSESAIIDDIEPGITCAELKILCANLMNLRSERIDIFLRGKCLSNDLEKAYIKPNDTVLVAQLAHDRIKLNNNTNTKMNTNNQRERTTTTTTTTTNDLGRSFNRIQLKLFSIALRNGKSRVYFISAKVMRILIRYFFSTTFMKFVSRLLIWSVMGSYAYQYELGPVFVLCSLFWLMFTNLSNDKKRKDGFSAYSVFNKNFEQLPGTFDAAQVDRNIRHDHD